LPLPSSLVKRVNTQVNKKIARSFYESAKVLSGVKYYK
jgi:hypothetical protein